MTKQENITTAFKLDISDFKKGITDANKQIKLANAEFNAATSEMDDWAESTDGLKAKIKQLTTVVEAQESKLKNYNDQLDAMRDAQDKNKKKTDDLREAIAEASAEFGEGSKEVKELQKALSDVEKEMISNDKAMSNLEVTILNQQGSVGKAKKELGNFEDALEDVGKASDEASDDVSGLGEGFSIVKGAIAGLIVEGITSFIGAIGNAIEETKEFRKEMGLLKSVADENKVSFDKVSEVYGNLLATRGDEGAVTETLNNLLSAGFDEKNLNKVTEGIEGLAIRFKDTLSQEGIADSIQEWIGSDGANLSGNFAEALERMGYNLETVQSKTKGLTQEQREQWVISTLAKEGLNDLSQSYREQNAGLIESSDAAFKMTQAMSGIAATVEPIGTAFKSGFADVLLTLGELYNVDLSGFANGVKSTFETVVGLLKGELSLGAVIDDMLTSITTNVPKLLQSGAEIIGNLGDGIKQNLPTLISKGLDIIMNLSQSLYDNFPTILKSGIELLRNLVQGIMDSLPELITKVPVILSNFANTINDNAPTIIKAGFDIILDIIKGLINAIPTLIANIPTIISAIVDVWSAFNWLNLGKNVVTKLGDGIKSMFTNIKTVATNLNSKVVGAVQGLPATLKTLGTNLVTNLGSAISSGLGVLKTHATNIFNTIWNAIKLLPEKMLGVGKDLVTGLWNGISNMSGWIADKISGFTGGVLDGIADFFGIHSPSRETAWLGNMLGEGLGVGITESIGTAVKSAKAMSDKVLGTLNGGLDSMNLNTSGVAGSVAAATSQVVNFNQTINSPKAVDRLSLYQNTKSLMFSAKGRLQNV